MDLENLLNQVSSFMGSKELGKGYKVNNLAEAVKYDEYYRFIL